MKKQDLYDAFHSVGPSDEQRKTMRNSILMKKEEMCNMKFKKPKMIAAVATIICVLVATTAFAIAYNLDSGFLGFLKPTPEQTEHLANGAYVVDKKVSNENGTLEVKQILGDENLVYILMDFTAPSGTVLDTARYGFDLTKTNYTARSGEIYGSDYTLIDDGNPSDNKISLIMSITSEHTTAGEDMTLTLVDLWASDGQFPAECKTVFPGKWKISFPLNFKNMSRSYDINKRITLYDETLNLKAVSISPLSINVYMTGDDVEKSIKGNNAFNKVFPITLVFNDGSFFTTTDNNSEMSAQAQYGKNILTSTQSFHQVIDSTQVKSIIIFDQEFMLK